MRPAFCAAVVLLALTAIAQKLTPAETAELARATKNPFDLAKFIDAHPAPGWQFDVTIATRRVVVAPDYQQRDFEPCTTKLLTVKTPEQAIVVIGCEFSRSSCDTAVSPTQVGEQKASQTPGIEYPKSIQSMSAVEPRSSA